MSQINFVDEFRAIMAESKKKGLPLRERMLWIGLFHMANDNAEYDPETGRYEWPDDFFPIANAELNLYTDLNKHAIEELRNKLKQRGYIDFRNGERRTKNPEYKIYYLTGGRIGDEKRPNARPNDIPNNIPNSIPNAVPNEGPRSGPLLVNINTMKNRETHTDRSSASSAREEEGFDNGWRTSERVRGAVAQRILDRFGGSVWDPEAHGKVCRLLEMGMPPKRMLDSISRYNDLEEWLWAMFRAAREEGLEETDAKREEEKIRKSCARASGGNKALEDALYRMEMRARESEANEG